MTDDLEITKVDAPALKLCQCRCGCDDVAVQDIEGTPLCWDCSEWLTDSYGTTRCGKQMSICLNRPDGHHWLNGPIQERRGQPRWYDRHCTHCGAEVRLEERDGAWRISSFERDPWDEEAEGFKRGEWEDEGDDDA